MSRALRCKLPSGAALAVSAGVVALGLTPAAADAADPATCAADALRLSVLGQPAVSPIHAGGGPVCADVDGTLASLPLSAVDVQAVTARTRATPTTSATATARIAGLRIGAGSEITGLLGAATGPLLTGPTSIVGQVNGLVGGLLAPLSSGPLAGLIGGIPVLGGIVLNGVDAGAVLTPLTASLTGALSSTLPNLVEAGVIEAEARATCSPAGVGTPSGAAQITGLRALGATVDANGAVQQAISLDTATLTLGRLLSVDDVLKSIRVQTTGLLGLALVPVIGTTQTTLYDLLHTTNPSVLGALNNVIAALSGGQTLGSILTGVTNTLQPLLDGTPVALPAGLVRVQVTPNRQTTADGTLTQQAVDLSVTALTRPVLAGTLAQASVSAGSAGCVPPVDPPVDPPVEPPVDVPVDPPTVIPPVRRTAPPTTPPPAVSDERYGSPEAEALLSCLRVPAMLIDVYGSGGRTRIHGATEQRYAGQQATIVLAAGNERVGRVKIGDDGLFSTTVALPPRAIRTSNRARYYAVVGGRRTSALKFSRRMLVTGLSARGRSVTLTGQVTAPRRARPEPVVVEQRVGCGTYTTVTRATPDRKGRFRVRVTAPEGSAATVYRARTRVPSTARSTRLRPTFSLPRVIGL